MAGQKLYRGIFRGSIRYSDLSVEVFEIAEKMSRNKVSKA
jgi:hypothetical protein